MMTTKDLQFYMETLVQDLIAKGFKKMLIVCDSWPSNKDDKLWGTIKGKYKDHIALEKLIIPAGKFKIVKL